MASVINKMSIFICLAAYFTSAYAIWADDARVDCDKVFAGKVLVEAVESRDGISGVRASFCVNARREDIWSALTDYDNFPKMYKGLKKISVLEKNRSGAKVEFFYTVDFLKIFNKELHYVLDRRYEPGKQITWSRLSGDLKRIDGSWEIRDTAGDGIYLLVYSAYVQPDGYVPVAFVRSGAMKAAVDMANRLRSWIEKPD